MGRDVGWVRAPSDIELEIRGVWLEDELPAEITNAPGYTRFTLSVDAQSWVDSMAELKDAGKYILGRPKPIVASRRRSFATPQPTSSEPAPTRPTCFSPPPPPAPSSAPPAQPGPTRILMPEIDEQRPAPNAEAASEPNAPPHVGTGGRMPEIGEDENEERPQRNPLMPDIGE